MNLVMLPMFASSDVFFASSNFPAALQPMIHILPLTAISGDGLRMVIIDGAGLVAVLPSLVIHAAWGIPYFQARAALFPLDVKAGAGFLPSSTQDIADISSCICNTPEIAEKSGVLGQVADKLQRTEPDRI